MGRYQGTSGAAWAASGRVRRPRGAPSGIPGKGKGLNDDDDDDDDDDDVGTVV